MSIVKLNETTVKVTETIIKETELSKDDILSKISNIDNQIYFHNDEISKLLIEKEKTQKLLDEVNWLWCITNTEFYEKNLKTELPVK